MEEGNIYCFYNNVSIDGFRPVSVPSDSLYNSHSCEVICISTVVITTTCTKKRYKMKLITEQVENL